MTTYINVFKCREELTTDLSPTESEADAIEQCLDYCDNEFTYECTIKLDWEDGRPVSSAEEFDLDTLRGQQSDGYPKGELSYSQMGLRT